MNSFSDPTPFVSAIVVVVVVLVIIILFVVIISFVLIYLTIFFLRKKLKKFENIEDIDILLEEKKIQDSFGGQKNDFKGPKFEISKELFQINSSDIKIMQNIGSGGSSSKVYLGKWSGNNDYIAYKVFYINEIEGDQKYSAFEKELKVISSIRHPNIVSFFGASIDSNNRIGLILEYCSEGDLKFFLTNFKKRNNFISYDAKNKLRMMMQVSNALSYMHSKFLIHRDLKAENILVNKSHDAKLSDFGLSKILSKSLNGLNNITQTIRVGTSVYIAPEVVISGKYDQKCDSFSMGILLFLVFTEKFDDIYDDMISLDSNNSKSTFGIELRVANDPNFRPNFPNEFLCKELRLLIQNLWKSDPSERSSMDIVNKELKSIHDSMYESNSNEEDVIVLKEQNLFLRKQLNEKDLKISQLEKEVEELKNKIKM